MMCWSRAPPELNIRVPSRTVIYSRKADLNVHLSPESGLIPVVPHGLPQPSPAWRQERGECSACLSIWSTPLTLFTFSAYLLGCFLVDSTEINALESVPEDTVPAHMVPCICPETASAGTAFTSLWKPLSLSVLWSTDTCEIPGM